MEEKCVIEPKSVWSDLWKTEDWLAVWIGFLVIIGAIFLYKWTSVEVPKLKINYRWTTQGQLVSQGDKWTKSVDSLVQNAQKAGELGTVNRLNALKEAIQKGERSDIEKAANKVLNIGGIPGELGKEVVGHTKAVPSKMFETKNLIPIIIIAVVYLVLSFAGLKVLGKNMGKFIAGFPIVFLLAWLSRIIAGNATAVTWGVEYVVFALAIGLLISNTVRLPGWVMEAVQTEFYIKSGLVVLGAGLLFFEVIQAGVLGIVQAVLVIFVVWYACFWISKKLHVDDEFAAMLSSAVAICGVSAAIASCGAIQGDKKKLSYVTSLVLIVAVPMMIIMPWIVKHFGIPDLVGGAWLGGTLDTSGSVVAAGALISEPAMKTGVIVKFSQNALIGVAAFILAIWWAFKSGEKTGEKPSARVIWDRFPKFVLGFIVASFIFSFFIHIDTVSDTKSFLSELRTWWFALAFVSIGLETRFMDLVKMEGGRPALAFISAQLLNVIWTFILAYLLFGGIIFPVPDIR
jgi:uncharacterized membrane protein YadS